MSAEQLVPETAPALEARIQIACDIATGKIPAPDHDSPRNVVGAKKDLNSKGNGPEWFRMVYRNGSWRYVSDDRLPSGKFLASDRRATVYGEVFAGEIIAGHDRGGQIDSAWIVMAEPDAAGKNLKAITATKQRDGQLAFALPDGSKVVLPNPRAK